MQDILDGGTEHHHRATHEFPYSGLIRRGHCGCSLVGEEHRKPSGKTYVYYHCTGYRGRCPEPYTRANVLEEQFLATLRSLVIPQDVSDWLTTSLRESTAEATHERDQVIKRLTSDVERLQARIDAMYVDKLDRKITQDFFDQKSGEWRAEQTPLQRRLATMQNDDPTQTEDTISMLGLSLRAATLFPNQSPGE